MCMFTTWSVWDVWWTKWLSQCGNFGALRIIRLDSVSEYFCFPQRHYSTTAPYSIYSRCCTVLANDGFPLFFLLILSPKKPTKITIRIFQVKLLFKIRYSLVMFWNPNPRFFLYSRALNFSRRAGNADNMDNADNAVGWSRIKITYYFELYIPK